MMIYLDPVIVDREVEVDPDDSREDVMKKILQKVDELEVCACFQALSFDYTQNGLNELMWGKIRQC